MRNCSASSCRTKLTLTFRIPHSAFRIRFRPMTSKPPERRQVVRFAFYKLDNAWRRLSAERQASSKIEFGEMIESFAGRLLLRPYGLVGIRGDCDFLLWQVAENLDALVALQKIGRASCRERV